MFLSNYHRVAPARGWFSNTKVISQNALQKFQEEMGNVQKDPYKVCSINFDPCISLEVQLFFRLLNS